MVKALFDTNVLIDFLGGIPAAKREIERYDDAAISIVAWMEVMLGAPKGVEDPSRAFLSVFAIAPLDPLAAERAAKLRQDHRIKLPDAIVWASAQMEERLFVTGNTKDFPAGDPGVRMPYRV
jgi:predicted nucleic acid-binding protein